MADLIFHDRQDAGRQLAEKLLHLKERNPIVFALPRGGVPVGAEIAKRLGAPLDVLMVRKIGVPYQPELALGAVVDGEQPQLTLNQDIVEALKISEEFIEQEKQRQLAEIAKRRALYCGERPPLPVKGRAVIIVDDGIATGATGPCGDQGPQASRGGLHCACRHRRTIRNRRGDDRTGRRTDLRH